MNSKKTKCSAADTETLKQKNSFFLRRTWYADYFRTTDDYNFVFLHFIRDFLFYHRLRFMIYLRWAQNSRFKIIRLWMNYKLFRYSRKYGIEIKSETKIGKGFCLVHPYNITISPYAVIGENVSMMKGSTIGIDKRGAPIIGNKVYIGLNSSIIGKVQIGNDVLIAPNTMVNVDVPSNSIAIGSPCKIISKENPTRSYIWKHL